MKNNNLGLKTLFSAELKYQFTSPTRIWSKVVGILVATLVLALELFYQSNEQSILAMSSMSLIIGIFGVQMSGIIQNLQSIDRLKTQFLIYPKKQVVLIRFLFEVINILLTILVLYLIIAIALFIKIDSRNLLHNLQLMGKASIASISFGLLIAYLGTLATTVKGSAKTRKIVGAIVAGSIYLIVLAISIVFPIFSQISDWFKDNNWILSLPIINTFLTGTFIISSSVAWIYAFLASFYVIIIIAITFNYYTEKIKLSITQD